MIREKTLIAFVATAIGMYSGQDLIKEKLDEVFVQVPFFFKCPSDEFDVTSSLYNQANIYFGGYLPLSEIDLDGGGKGNTYLETQWKLTRALTPLYNHLFNDISSVYGGDYVYGENPWNIPQNGSAVLYNKDGSQDCYLASTKILDGL